MSSQPSPRPPASDSPAFVLVRPRKPLRAAAGAFIALLAAAAFVLVAALLLTREPAAGLAWGFRAGCALALLAAKFSAGVAIWRAYRTEHVLEEA
jgi:hypothetical protein